MSVNTKNSRTPISNLPFVPPLTNDVLYNPEHFNEWWNHALKMCEQHKVELLKIFPKMVDSTIASYFLLIEDHCHTNDDLYERLRSYTLRGRSIDDHYDKGLRGQDIYQRRRIYVILSLLVGFVCVAIIVESMRSPCSECPICSGSENTGGRGGGGGGGGIKYKNLSLTYSNTGITGLKFFSERHLIDWLKSQYLIHSTTLNMKLIQEPDELVGGDVHLYFHFLSTREPKLPNREILSRLGKKTHVMFVIVKSADDPKQIPRDPEPLKDPPPGVYDKSFYLVYSTNGKLDAESLKEINQQLFNNLKNHIDTYTGKGKSE